MELPVKTCKTQRNLITIMIQVLLALQLAGCTSRSGSSPEFPTGLYECVECTGTMARFMDDGTYVVYMRGAEYIKGKYTIEGDVFHTGDNYCRDEEAMPASYQWNFDGEILAFQIIVDGCPDRIRTLDKKPWKLIKTE